MTATLPAVCSACRIDGRQVPATHVSRYGDGHAWCAFHARPGDPPLAVAPKGAERGLIGEGR